MIEYIEGDLFDHVPKDKFVIIPHVCNTLGKWGAGFVIPLGKKYPKAKDSYLELHKINAIELGHTDFVQVSSKVVVANMIAQDGIGSKRCLRYNHLATCLDSVAEYARLNKMEIHAPMFGSGLAGGKWEFISELINDSWISKNLKVFIYAKVVRPQNNMTDLVLIKKEDGSYIAEGGPEEAIFTGRGNTDEEAIGSWVRQNREAINFCFSTIDGNKFFCSTQNGKGRSKQDLGPNELKALNKFFPD